MPEGARHPIAWERVKEVLADALELPREERAAFLQAACGGDEALRAEVASLLPSADTEERFLAQPVHALFDAPEPPAGARLGAYTLRSVLGEGGMGRVYEATQEHPHRTVALKILRPGFLAPEAERRFRFEVEALGRLNHPTIARVHEAGVAQSEDGRPLSWFAMERVEGRPLLAAADALGLDRDARLALFARICDGVAHAHRRGVIHRDLKPDNILVDDAGSPHILDFGIARAVDPLATAMTSAGEIVGTLEYMSPEQVLGDPERVDSRSDVYALGLLLYRLLTGRAPHDLAGLTLPQVAVLLAEADPTPAGRHDASLRGDLETILATALARDVERRYASTDQLAAEVRRVLADEPIHARAPTAWYQLTKFARRHRGLVAGLALSLVLLVVAVIGTTAGFVRASQARDEAVDERDRARAINAFLDRMLASAQPELLGLDARLSDLLALAGAELEVDADLSPTVRAALQVTLGRTNLALGRLEPGLEQLERATRTFTERDGAEAATTLDARSYLASALMDLGRLDEARQQLAEVERAVAAVENPPAWMRVLPARLQGELFETAGDWVAAAASYRAVEAALKVQPDLDHETLASVLGNLATPLMELGENDAALEVLLESQALRESLVGPEHPSTLALRNNLAMQLNQIGRSAESVQRMEPLVEQAGRELGPRHNLTLTIRNNFATSLSDAGRLEEALAVYEDVHRLQADSLGPAHRDTLITRNNLASTLLYLERPSEAVEQLRWILDALQRSEAGDDPVFRLRVEMNLAAGLMNQELSEEALPVATRVVETLEELAGEGHIQALISRNNLAMLLLQMGRFDEAERHARRNLELAREHQPGHPVNVFPFQMNLGRALAAGGHFDEAEPVLLDVARALEEDPDALAANRARIAEVLAETYDAWDRPGDAARWRARSY